MDKEILKLIYRKTDGYCHLCFKKLNFANYGKLYADGSWQIEHSRCKAKGGSDHLNNLFPACVECNLEKGTLSSRTVRSRNGRTRAPFSKQQKSKIRIESIFKGIIIGSVLGLAFVGPFGGILCGAVGGVIGNDNSPKK